MEKTKTRKRPCKICRRWFMPHARQKQRQKTCGRAECQKELHRRQCQRWNQRNKDYFNYLAAKLKCMGEPPDGLQPRSPPIVPPSRIQLRLPKDIIINSIGANHLIIQEYIAAQIIHRMANKAACQPANVHSDFKMR
jgi:hypothetical protein